MFWNSIWYLSWEETLRVWVSVVQIFHWQFLAFVKSFWGIEAGQSEWNWGNTKTFVEDKLCPGQTRHNVNNLQIVKLLPIFLAWSQIVFTRLQDILITAEVTRGQVRTSLCSSVSSRPQGWVTPSAVQCSDKPRRLARDGAGAWRPGTSDHRSRRVGLWTSGEREGEPLSRSLAPGPSGGRHNYAEDITKHLYSSWNEFGCWEKWEFSLRGIIATAVTAQWWIW